MAIGITSPVIVDLPWPPSLNRLWRVRRGRVYRSKAYMQWLKEADGVWMAQKPKGRFPTIRGTFKTEIILIPPSKRRPDLDNLSKAAMDFLQRVEIIANDSNSLDLHMRFGQPGEAPLGLRVLIEPIDKMP